MHLRARQEPDHQHRGDGEPDGGERRAETHIHRALQLIVERRMQRRKPLGRQHQHGDEDAAKLGRPPELLDAEMTSTARNSDKSTMGMSVKSSMAT